MATAIGIALAASMNAGAQSAPAQSQAPTCVEVASAPQQHVGKQVSWVVRLRDVEGEAPKQRTICECRDATGAWSSTFIGPSAAELTSAPSVAPTTLVRGQVQSMRGRIVGVEQRTLTDGTRAAAAVVGEATLAVMFVDTLEVLAPGPSNGVSWPEVLHEEKPRYTQEAMRAKIEGLVELEVIVLAAGKVGSVRVTKSLDKEYGLDQAAIEAARKWMFKPGMRGGVPVPTRVGLMLEFRLRK